MIEPTSDWLRLLPIVPLLPLVGAVLLATGGRWVSDRASAWLATLLVGLSFLVSIAVGVAYLTRDAPALGAGEAGTDAARAPVQQRLWRWMAVGDDLVEVTAAVRPIGPDAAVPSGSVGTLWASPLDGRVATRLRDMWAPDAVAGQRSGDAAVGAYEILGLDNVRPEPGPFVSASPRWQRALRVDVALRLDGLSLTMMLLVTGVSSLILLYSIGYMRGDPGIRRFFAYMDLFVFGMLVLVLAADFLVLFVGWELVGLCSYLLIGFWHAEPANADAGRKAFVVNRVGDFAFLVGLMLIWSVFGSLAYTDVLPAAGRLLPMGGGLAVAIAALLLAGATGKSAQIPLFVWLPDAMAGPSPVSALIHAATMVTAGVYMMVRAAPLFERAPQVLAAVALIGGATALMAAAIALVQIDIKRVLAYSTISQLGYMFMAVGVGAYVAAMAHLVVHAFFKALLFLGAGSVMHALAHGFDGTAGPAPQDGVPPEQDMRRMGGLLHRLPISAWTFVVGGLALAGLFPLSGFFSKDEILFETLARSARWASPWTALWAVGLLTAFLTALYTGRQIALVFGGAPRSEGARRAVEPGAIMTAPLVALAVLAAAGGALVIPAASALSPIERLLGTGPHQQAAVLDEMGVAIAATAACALGLGTAWFVYARRSVDPERFTRLAPWAYRLARRRFLVDEVYDRVLVRPYRRLASVLWTAVDDSVLDGAVNATGRAALLAARLARRTQTGRVRAYLWSLLVGAVLVGTVLLLLAR